MSVKGTARQRPNRRPASTPEARENQMVALAINLAEKQLMDGTASAQIIHHFVKLGSSREQLEQQKLRADNDLQLAKIETMASGKRMEELYAEAINAMREYAGGEFEDEEEGFYDD